MPGPALLFDFDGLLIDSETAGLRSWQEVFTEHGQELDLAYWLAEVAAGRGPVMPTAQLEGLLGQPVDWEKAEPRRLARRDELLAARPGAARLLSAARQARLATAIVSNAPDWWITRMLAHAGLDEHRFDVVIAKSPDRAGKPAPDAYLAALSALGVPPDGAIAFEDSPVGVAAARGAAVFCVGVANDVTGLMGPLDADLTLGSLADITVADLAGLVPAAGRPR